MAGETSCVVLLSGGMDSATLLAKAKRENDKVTALTLNYAQRHKVEIKCAMQIAKHFKVSHKVLDVSNINSLLQGSALTSKDIEVPKGHYEDESMKLTVVPARNTILLSLALGWCITCGFNIVAYAAHAGDHAIYPDCRPAYIEAMQEVFDRAHYWPVKLWVPFMFMNKGDILKEGFKLKVPYEKTWTCYDPQEIVYTDRTEVVACGKCGSCTERLEGFNQNSIVDPIQYVVGTR
jgi:7-cyano-7-deazaguanine synthase